MRRRAWILVGLIVTQAVALYVVRGATAYAIVMGLLAIVGALGTLLSGMEVRGAARAGAVARFSLPSAAWRPRRRNALFVVLALSYAVFWYFSGREEATRVPFGMLGGFPTDPLARYLILGQVLHLYLRDPDAPGRPLLGGHLPLVGAITMGAIAYTLAPESTHRALVVVLACFAALCAFYYGALRRDIAPHRSYARLVVSAVVLVVALISGAATSIWLAENALELDRMLGFAVSPPGMTAMPGLGERARLDSIFHQKTRDEETVLARVEAEHTPGYLRARAFERFDGREWYLSEGKQPLARATDPPDCLQPLAPEEYCYRLPDAPDSASGGRRLDVWTNSRVQNLVLAPLDTNWIATRDPRVLIDAGRSITFTRDTTGPGVPPCCRAAVRGKNRDCPKRSEARRTSPSVPLRRGIQGDVLPTAETGLSQFFPTASPCRRTWIRECGNWPRHFSRTARTPCRRWLRYRDTSTTTIPTASA